jgi:uncharacterized protein (TIGR03083 family)
MVRVEAVPPVSSLGLVEEYAAAADRFAATVGWSELHAPVPSCPGWTVRDVVVHLANEHAWAATIVETGRRADRLEDQPRGSRPRSVREWYVAKAEDLYQVLRHTPPQRPCWTWLSQAGTAHFWQRRQVHETTIHRVDLDEAAGRGSELSAQVATDGVDEALSVMMHRMHRRGHPAALDGPVQLTAPDTGDSWLVAPGVRFGSGLTGVGAALVPAPPSVERLGSSDAAVAADRVEASAADLYRMLWHRRATGRVRVRGDEARVRAFLASRLTP